VNWTIALVLVIQISWILTGFQLQTTKSKAISTPDVNISTDNAIGDVSSGTMDDQTTKIQAHELSKDFVQWVNQGEAFWY